MTRVIEVSDREESAAFAGKLFARWGAEVIKVEHPERATPRAALDRYVNGGKRRVALDYRDAGDLERLRALSATADVVVLDAPPDDIEAFDLLSLGAGHAAACISITPFGLDGPYRDFEATASTLLALGGHTWLMGDPGRAPLTMPGQYPYRQAGTFAYIAALASMLSGERGRRIEVAELEVLASVHQFTDTMWQSAGVVRHRRGNRWQNLCPTTLLPCADGWFGVNILQAFWPSFASMIGHPEYIEDHEYALNSGRMAHEDAVEADVLEALGDWPKARIFTEGQETWRVPIGTALDLDELLEDRHLEARGFWRPLGASGLRSAGSPFAFVGSEPPVEADAEPRGSADASGLAAGASASMTRAEVAEAPRPLQGVRVLDLTRIWSGPLAARILGDLGAEVIKIEAPLGRGPREAPDNVRTNNPEAGTERYWNRQALFNKLQRNRLGVAIDLKHPRGREAFLDLVRQSDVVIENFSARAMPSLGLGYDDLRAAKPDIVYMAMPAFGLNGPYRDYIGLGPSIEPVTGLTSMMGYSDEEPRVTSKAITDAMAGVAAASAVLTALERRDRTGEGALIDLSQHEVGVAYLGEYVLEQQLGEQPQRLGNAHTEWAPHGVYRCAGDDEWIAIAARDDEEWRALADLAGRGWASEVAFGDVESRRAHRADLDATIEGWTAGQEKHALMRELQARRVPAGAVQKPQEWTVDAHLEARDYFTELEHAEVGPFRSDGSPLRFDGARGTEAWRAAPCLGADNREVLSRLLGMTDDQIDELASLGVIVEEPPA
ncbi:MAG: CoA transferase [Dehalococcoidia bacterium]